MSKQKINYNHITFSNNISEPMRKTQIIKLSNSYHEKTHDITTRIARIIELIHKTNPLDLMNFLTTTDYFSSALMGSEIEYSKEQILQNRAIEYVQSLLVSDAIQFSKLEYDKKKQEPYFYQIQSETIALYEAIEEWYFYWAAYAEYKLKIEKDDILYIVEAQLFSQVRGKRYQFQFREHFDTLLQPLDKLLQDNYDISANELIDGLLSIERSLTQDRGKAVSQLRSMMLNPDFDFENPQQKFISEGTVLFETLFGNASNDIEGITNWPVNFIKKLSLSIDEFADFSQPGFNYWPIISLPIQKKPFIEIEGKYYCFAYYNLFDNIYRILQKLLFDTNTQNINLWEQIQKNSSETAISNIFQKLLPNCTIFKDNYYPRKISLKQMNENDIIVEYENSLIIVEVKAGSFSPIPAIINYQSHLKSYQSLVEKADQQCQRTVDYLKRSNESSIYDKQKHVKKTFQMNDYDYIYTMCVTIDDFNEFAARAEKLNKVNIAAGTIVISIEDLRTYKDYFQSPFIFLNFLENRTNATQIEQMRLTDELDHLGMYIEHNMYPKTFSNGKKNMIFQGFGYREQLDNYFMSLWSTEEKLRPERDFDDTRRQLLCLLGKNDLRKKLIFSNFLLDFSTEGADFFSKSIVSLQRRQLELKRMVPAISAGKDCRYVLFIDQPDIEKYPRDMMLKYCNGMLAYGNFSNLILIHLYVDSEMKIIDFWFEEKNKQDIPLEKLSELKTYGEITFGTRFQKMIGDSKKKKIGRNSPCPCGSGLKYKKCCGK